jgi:iron complex outermembrane recepter protein
MRNIPTGITRSGGAALRVSLCSLGCIHNRLAAVLFLLAATAFAAGVHAEAPGDGTFTLGTVEIIGKRIAADTAVTTDTVSADVLAARHRDDLSEALDLIPGIAIQNTGQRRERTISVRGFTSRQVPLFIDGVPVYVPYDGMSISRALVWTMFPRSW